MKQELITVIEKTIYALENNTVKYDWTESTRCNCGTFAKQTCSESELESSICLPGGLWSGRAKKCKKTDKNLHIVFSKLFNLGLEKKDIIHLENLSDGRVLKRFDKNAKLERSGFDFPQNVNCDEKDYLIKYLKAWRDLLIEESQPKVEYKLVYSDQKVKDLVNKKLILS